MKYRSTPSYKQSQGAVLIVGLVLLLTMTLIGVAAIDSSSLQSDMAANSLEEQRLFQVNFNEELAQFEEANDAGYRIDVRNSNSTIPTSDSITYSGPGLQIPGDIPLQTDESGDAYELSGTVVFSREGAMPLHGYSLNRFNVMEYEINIVAGISNTESESDQTLGFAHAAPLGQD